jgi:predicted DsbA family dithiol-disulfide isomerase/uncharacterized membrane protein
MPSERAVRNLRLAWILVPALVGLVASAMLLVDYVRPLPVFCEEGGGCDAVKHTSLAWVGPLPTPALGLFGFLVCAGLTLARGPLARFVCALGATFGAAFAVVLVSTQAQMGTYCIFCMFADVSIFFVASAAWMRVRTKWDLPAWSPESLATIGAVVLAVGVPLATGALRTPKIEVPQVIVAERARTPKGQTTVVDFVDFECPFCRMTHEQLAPLLEQRKDRLRVVRKQVPLRMHPHAMDAARAACCGEKLGRGDAMADALFKAPVDDLTPDGCEKIALSIGLSIDTYRSCVSDPGTDARIKADTEEFRAAKAHGLPTIWIDDRRIEGAQPAEILKSVLDDALTRAGS